MSEIIEDFLHTGKGNLSGLLLSILGAGAIIYGFFIQGRKESRGSSSDGLKKIPEVTGGLPFIGHGLSIALDKKGFLHGCFQKYGGIFQLKFFRKKVVVLGDRTHANELFRATDDTLAFYDRLASMYFEAGLRSKNGLKLKDMMQIIKKATNLAKTEEMLPRIYKEAEILMSQLKQLVNKGPEGLVQLDLTKIFVEYVANVSTHCFVGVRLDNNTFEDVYQFAQILNHALLVTYILPVWATRWVLGWRLDQLRNRIIKYFVPEIEKYKKDLDKNDFPMLRSAVDTVNPITGELLTVEEVGEVIMCLLYVSTENPALGLKNVLMDLARNPNYWDRAVEEVRGPISQHNLKDVVTSPLLNSCVLETTRLNSHLFAVGRMPIDKTLFGTYDVSGVDEVVTSEILWHNLGSGAEQHFSNPLVYNPDRFTRKEKKESSATNSIITWGSGVHACPGRNFAIHAILIGLSLFLTRYSLSVPKTAKTERNFFSPTSVFEKKRIPTIQMLG